MVDEKMFMLAYQRPMMLLKALIFVFHLRLSFHLGRMLWLVSPSSRAKYGVSLPRHQMIQLSSREPPAAKATSLAQEQEHLG